MMHHFFFSYANPARKIKTIFTTLGIMAQLSSLPQDSLQWDLANKDKIKIALEFLYKNPNETPTTTVHIFHLEKGDSIQKA
jgi:hypothetical protein